MKTADMRQMKRDDLHAEITRLERHLFDLRAQAVTEKLADPTQLGKTRRDIARLLTIMREKELAGAAKHEKAALPQQAAAAAPAAKAEKPKAATKKPARAKKATKA